MKTNKHILMQCSLFCFAIACSSASSPKSPLGKSENLNGVTPSQRLALAEEEVSKIKDEHEKNLKALPGQRNINRALCARLAKMFNECVLNTDILGKVPATKDLGCDANTSAVTKRFFKIEIKKDNKKFDFAEFQLFAETSDFYTLKKPIDPATSQFVGDKIDFVSNENDRTINPKILQLAGMKIRFSGMKTALPKDPKTSGIIFKLSLDDKVLFTETNLKPFTGAEDAYDIDLLALDAIRKDVACKVSPQEINEIIKAANPTGDGT